VSGFLEVCLYLVGAWFTLAAISLAIFAANRPGRRQKAALLALSVLAACVAIAQVLAAGDLK